MGEKKTVKLPSQVDWMISYGKGFTSFESKSLNYECGKNKRRLEKEEKV